MNWKVGDIGYIVGNKRKRHGLHKYHHIPVGSKVEVRVLMNSEYILVNDGHMSQKVYKSHISPTPEQLDAE